MPPAEKAAAPPAKETVPEGHHSSTELWRTLCSMKTPGNLPGLKALMIAHILCFTDNHLLSGSTGSAGLLDAGCCPVAPARALPRPVLALQRGFFIECGQTHYAVFRFATSPTSMRVFSPSLRVL